MQLHYVKNVVLNDSRFGSFFSPFLKIFPNNNNNNNNNNKLEKLSIHVMTRIELDGFLCALQNDNYNFRQSLTTIDISASTLDEDDLGRILFDILPRFPDLHSIEDQAMSNMIGSVRGIEDRIKQLRRRQMMMSSSSSSSASASASRAILPNNSLRNFIPLWKVLRKKDRDPKETAALLAVLDAFQMITNLGVQ